MNSSVPGSQHSKVPDDVQYAVQVKLTPDVLQALLNAQKVGDHVSIRFAEGNKTDVWTIGNQQFAFKSAREEKSGLLEVVRCSGDLANGAPCSPVACVYKKLHFPKSTADVDSAWKQAQAASKKQEKRVAKLLDVSFQDNKGVAAVKHTVRHTTPPVSRPTGPPRPASKFLVLGQSRGNPRQVTPPPVVPRDIPDAPPRPAVKTLNPPKPRSLKPGLQKKEPVKPNNTSTTKSNQARPVAGARQAPKPFTPSPPQRSTPPLHQAAPKGPSRSGQSGSPDVAGTVSSQDDGVRRVSSGPAGSDEVKKSSPPQHVVSSSGLRSYEPPTQHVKRSDGISGSVSRRDSEGKSFAENKCSPNSQEVKGTSQSPPSQTAPYETKRAPSPFPSNSQNDSKRSDRSHESKRPERSPPSQTTGNLESSNPLRQSPYLRRPHTDDLSRPQDRPSSGPSSDSLDHVSQTEKTMYNLHKTQHQKYERPSPPVCDQYRYDAGHKLVSQERSSLTHIAHPDGPRINRSGGAEETSPTDRPSSQDSLWVNNGSQRAERSAINQSQPSAPRVDEPHKPRRTPSLPNLHRMEENTAHGVPLSPPMSHGERIHHGSSGERMQRSHQPPLPAPSRSAGARPVADGKGSEVLGKHKRSQSLEDGELKSFNAKRPMTGYATQSAPPASQPVATNSSSPLKRSREEASSPPSTTHDGNAAPTKKLVLKIRRPSECSTPSNGGSSGGLSSAAHPSATPEVSTRATRVTADSHDAHAQQKELTNREPSPREFSGTEDQHRSTTNHHSSRAKHAASPEDGPGNVADLCQAGSMSLADTQPTSSGSPVKAAMAYTPEQDDDEQEYMEFVSRKGNSVPPVRSHDEYIQAKERYQQLHDLYYKLRSRSECFILELNALHRSVHSQGNTEQSAEFRQQALELIGRKAGVFERWQKALGNLKSEINGLKDAAGSWRRSVEDTSLHTCS